MSSPKVCPECGRELNRNLHFYRNASHRDGADTYCIACVRLRRQRILWEIDPTTVWQTCRRCQNIFPLTEYDRSGRTALGWVNRCRSCRLGDNLRSLQLRCEEYDATRQDHLDRILEVEPAE